MKRYIAFLRAINVGSHNVKMEHLKSLFKDMGFSNVGSYINSGNIFFETDDVISNELSSRIEIYLENSLGYAVPTFLRSVSEVEEIVSNNPFRHIDLKNDIRFSVVFVKEKLDVHMTLPVANSKSDMEIIALNEHEAYAVWHIINGRPPAGKFSSDILPKENTSRYYHTLVKILAAAKKDV